MAQIDFLLFLPHLFWFIILFLFFYFLIFSYFLPIVFESLKLKQNYLSVLFKYIDSLFVFYSSLNVIFFNFIYKSLLHLISTCYFHLLFNNDFLGMKK